MRTSFGAVLVASLCVGAATPVGAKDGRPDGWSLMPVKVPAELAEFTFDLRFERECVFMVPHEGGMLIAFNTPDRSRSHVFLIKDGRVGTVRGEGELVRHPFKGELVFAFESADGIYIELAPEDPGGPSFWWLSRN